MRCLSIQNPFAAAIIHGPKRVENRSWKTSLPTQGEWIAVHTGKKPFQNLDRRWFHSLWPSPVFATEKGVLLGAMFVEKIVPVETIKDPCPWTFGPYVWVITDVVALPVPLPIKGHQRLFHLPLDLAGRLETLIRTSPCNSCPRLTNAPR